MNTAARIALIVLIVVSLVCNAVQYLMLDKATLEIADHHVAMETMADEIAWHRAQPEIVHVTVYADPELIMAMLQSPATSDWQYNVIPFYMPEGIEIDPLHPGCPGEEFESVPDENDLLYTGPLGYQWTE